MNSKELNTVQLDLSLLVSNMLSANAFPDYSEVSLLISAINLIDNKRREAWNEEKFGESETIANSVLDSDDIPF